METYIDHNYAVTANTICSYYGDKADFTVPSRVALIDIHTIGRGAFYGNGRLNSLRIPKHITTLGAQAFCQCSKLSQVVFEEPPASSGAEIFGVCPSLQTIVFEKVHVSHASYQALKSNSLLLSDGLAYFSAVPDGFFSNRCIESEGVRRMLNIAVSADPGSQNWPI